MNNLIQVEESINYCINIIDDNEQIALQGTQTTILNQKNDKFNFSILYSSIKYLKGRMKDAIDIILHIINKYNLNKTNCPLNAFLAFLYHESGNNILFIKHYEAAKRFKMIELGIDLRKPKFNPKVKTKYKSPTLTNEQCNSIWYNLITFFNEHEFCEISDKLLQFIDEEGQKEENPDWKGKYVLPTKEKAALKMDTFTKKLKFFLIFRILEFLACHSFMPNIFTK